MASENLRRAGARVDGMDLAKMFSVDGTGMISKVVLRNALRRFDEQVFTDETLNELLDVLGGEPDSKVSIVKITHEFSKLKVEDETEGEEAVDEEAEEKAKIERVRQAPRRVSFAAESIPQEHLDGYTKPVHEKDAAATQRIREKLKAHEKVQVLMGHLSDGALQDVINAFHAKHFDEGVDIIRQGDNGDCLYIIDEGSVDIFVWRPGPDCKTRAGDKGAKVCTWGAGALFGELALMYNAPRAATVTAASAVKAWCLDALDFKMLLMGNSQARYQKYEGWLAQVPILSSLNHFELSRLADVMESELFDADEDIVKQGDIGDKFFIIEDGTAAAYIGGDQGELRVKEYRTVGQYFGEIALLTEEPRKATVRAIDQGCAVASISKEDFTNLLGPIADILKQDIGKYPQYAEFLK